MSEQDELLSWIQQRIEDCKKRLDRTQETDLTYLIQGRLDAYRNVLAFVQTEGKLR